MNTEQFIERLREIVKDSGKKYNEISYELDKSHGYISAVLSGKQTMSQNDFFRFCEVVGVTEKQFFTLDDKHPCREYELLCEIKKLPDKVMLTYLEQIKAINEAAGRK